MKRSVIFFALIVLCCCKVKAQYVGIPDSVFRSFLQNNYPGCMNAQGQLDTTCNDILVVESLFLLPFGTVCENNYRDLTGIQYFKSLKNLDVSGNQCIQTLPFINTLKKLAAYDCAPIKLSSLPNGLKFFASDMSFVISFYDNRPPFINDNGHLPDSLEYLSIKNNFNQDTFTLPSLPNGLKHLNIELVNVDSLPPLPDSLEYLNCTGNRSLHTLHTLPLKLRHLEYWNTSITSLSALPYSLRYLFALGLEEVPPLPPYLKYLSVSVYGQTTFPELPASLDTFIIYSGESITSIGRLPDSLKYFSCTGTIISSLVNLPGRLQSVSLDGNVSLTTIPPLPVSLKQLTCINNAFTTLPDMTSATGLTYLTISGSQLTTLPPLPSSVKILTCENNPLLTTLPASAGVIDTIICRRNSLTSLPALSNRVKVLDCSVNQLTSLPPLPDSLNDLVFHYNQINEIPKLPKFLSLLVTFANPIRCLPVLHEGFIVVYLDTAQIHCVPNIPAYSYFMPAAAGPYYYEYYWQGNNPYWMTFNIQMPLCSPLNNVNNCQSFPVISGNIFYDINSNGIKDNGEYDKAGAKVLLDNSNTSVFSNRNGYFEVSADTTGASSITMEPVLFYNTVPSTASYNFITNDTIVSKMYALQPNQVRDSITLNLVPLTWAARPGFSYPYLISYENIGTTVLNPVLNVTYDNTKLIYDSSDAALVNNGSSLSLSVNNFVPGQTKNVIAYFRINPAAVLGDTLTTQAGIVASTQNHSQEVSAVIGGAFDPNDKHATPQLSPSQVSNGEYIDYTVRFQNTGTDTAFNIVISDTLSDDLQANTLQMIASSHNCKATVKDNIIFFEFLNILLPDSNVNEPKSHGFVSFRIKPQATVAVNTIIPNSAAIYFDYNAPVITNTATTLIKEFTVIPLKLISFSAVLQNGNTTALYWNTANEINTKYFVIERSNDGLRFNSVTTVFAKGKASNNYNAAVADANTGIIFYRLKIIDNDGSFTYSPIIKIDRRKNAAGFSVLSNPVKDFIIISTPDRTLNNTQVTIINMQGAVVKTFIVKEGSQTIDVNDLPNGIYYIKSINGSQKILVQ